MNAQAGREVTIAEAAEFLSVPAGTIRSWRGRHQITPVRYLRGRGRGGQVALYRLDEVRAVAERHK